MIKTIEQKRRHADYMRNYWIRKPDKQNNHRKNVRTIMAERRITLKEIYKQWRSSGCIICGELKLRYLVAHHIDPSIKKFTLSVGVKQGKSIDAFNAELNKCICLCEDCHTKYHNGILSLPTL